ncbi:tryptophan--tRNA ligase [Thalassolituus sp.]|uniref:tryptophan--tRNA ligase n=1 Tax=Thalassolituus sp. TaxID=2030822 RepID=UPI0035126526
MSKQRVLTGITTTGTPHLGNYVGAIRPAIEASRDTNNESFYFLADFHALIKCQDPAAVHQSTKEIAATWLALGLDTDNAVFYRQSDVPEIPQLTWFLNCICAKGLMNRAHAYKAAVDANLEEGEDADKAVTMGLFSYPVLMAADILMFGAHKVPVGKDQIQHVEMARDMAQRFNHIYCKNEPLLTLPDYQVDDDAAVLQGLDGRKMSKSYGNTIPLFLPEKKLQKHINKIKTNLLEPGEPKDPDTSAVFQIWKAFATQEQTAEMRQAFAEGIGWGDAKKKLFALINEEVAEARERYEDLLARPADIEAELQKGAEKARSFSRPMLEKVRAAVGISGLA